MSVRRLFVAVIVGVVLVLLVAAAMWFINPSKPVREEDAFRRQATAIIENGLLEMEATWEVGPWRYRPPLVYFIIPVPGAWSRTSVLTARSTSHPDFAVRTEVSFSNGYESFQGSTTNLTDALKWKANIEALPPDRRDAFMKWWPNQPSAERLDFLVPRIDPSPDPGARYGEPDNWPTEGAWPTAATGFPAPAPSSLPQDVSPSDVYVVRLESLETFDGFMLGWSTSRRDWVRLATD